MIREIRNCNDCGAEPGEAHEPGCDVARCMWTGEQAIQCSDGLVAEAARQLKADGHDELCEGLLYHFSVELDHDCGDDIWSGEWPGLAECREFGFWTYFRPDYNEGVGWQRVPAGHPRGTEDLNTLVSWCRWDRDAKRWVLPDGKLPAGMPS